MSTSKIKSGVAAIAFLGFTTLGISDLLAAETGGSDRQFGPWVCHLEGSVVVAAHPYKDGSKVMIGATRAATALFVDDPSLNLDEGAIYPFKTDIDGDLFSGTAKAIDSTTLAAPDLAEKYLHALYSGASAVVTAGGQRYGMTLEGARQCLDYGVERLSARN